ncbi:hypothetical protein HU200_005433 [Digitaria exilis]|uniref:Uncharacterized protein n=1 Tax=Digitaria exilis TaxID=1010633 RepID=A0A835KSY0_9POAL|nr:hypothetical protein HU200_005433 [Digitaria exilis]
MEECSSSKPTVKRLMEDELGKVKQLKIPDDEIQRILADLGHDVYLDKKSTQNSKSKGDQNYSTSITTSVPSGSLDPSGSKCMEETEDNELEFALADFLGQIHRYHDKQPHKNCNDKDELCTELKVLIQTKLNEILKDKSETAKYPKLQISRSLMLKLTLCTPKKLTNWIAPENMAVRGASQQSKADINHRKYVPANSTIRKVVPSCFHLFSYVDEFMYFTLKDMVEGAEPVQESDGMVPSSPENDMPECREPMTPRSSAPTEVISQLSPDGNHEKQDQPSPVSVLDPFFHEDVDSPNHKNVIKCITQFTQI